MEIDFVNEWKKDIPLFQHYTMIEVGMETLNLTNHSQRTFTFVILGLGVIIFWTKFSTTN